MTKAVRVHQYGGPEVLTFEDVPDEAPGPGQVRLHQRAIGLNYIDVYQRTGLYPSNLPLVPGNEGAGDIVALGPNVTEFKVGDRAAYGMAIGAYAQERLIAADRIVKLPDSISYETAAAMMLKGLTAQYLLRQTFRVEPGQTILVHAAAGGVGLILCQWGRALGATVIGTVGSQDKAKLARDAGAHHTILYRTENFAARVKEITDGKLCDVVYDGVGKATFPASLDCLRPRGLFASFGSSSGQVEAFNINILASKGSLFATRPTLATYASDRGAIAAMAGDLFEVVGSGKVKIAINHRYPLAEAAKAHAALEARETTGATVLLPDMP
ncbi:MAG: quinone oxidoreductase [Methylobacteriaceae bacterium]|nr:quinone oxidoreductase [Methylobacteriaceae bacterium]